MCNCPILRSLVQAKKVIGSDVDAPIKISTSDFDDNDSQIATFK